MPKVQATHQRGGALPQRVFIVIMDSVGCGAMPDAALFGDEGADTLGNVARAVGGLRLPCLQQLGIGNMHPVAGVPPVERPVGSWGTMHEASAGKDTTTGHWEIAGLVSEEPFATFPEGFPPSIVDPWLEATGLTGVLWNRPASGTEIIAEWGIEHVRTGHPILYTSADSVFQVAAHEEHFGLERLYEVCTAARPLLDEHRVARVIARPFVGTGPEDFQRTYNRHDYSMVPPRPTLLDDLKEAGIPVVGLGKIGDIFANRGLTESVRTRGNAEGMQRLLEHVASLPAPGFAFLNLIDFDMLYGHRRDTEGYAQALEAFDVDLAPVVAALGPRDLLLITADHGCDPTFAATTDHTREQVPLLAYWPGHSGRALGTRSTFADMAATVAQALGLPPTAAGTSFLDMLRTSA